jgi:hypothetical protein
MTLNELIMSLERRQADTPDTPYDAAEVSVKTAPIGACTPYTPDTPQKCSAEDVLQKAAQVIQQVAISLYEPRAEGSELQSGSYLCRTVAGEPDAMKAEPFKPLLGEPHAPLSQVEEITLLN